MNKPKKTYVLDTNVLLLAPGALESFDDHFVVLPDVVLEELDQYKRHSGEIGYNARQVARKLDEFRKNVTCGNLIDGYRLKNGGVLRVELNHENVDMPILWERNADYRVLKICKGIKVDNQIMRSMHGKAESEQVILVSNDSYMRIKASVLGIDSEEYRTDRTPPKNESYKGRTTLYTAASIIESIYQKGSAPIEGQVFYSDENLENEFSDFVENMYIVLKGLYQNQSVVAFYSEGLLYKCLEYSKLYNIKAQNAGQVMMLDAFMATANDIPLAIVKGPAGTGKTLLSVAAGLTSVDNGVYERVLYLRGNTKLDEDIGYLPGTEQEKLEWATRPIKDNLERIFKQGSMKYQALQAKIENVFQSGKIQVEAVAFMRGRSLNDTFLIIDEAQNLTPKQIKTLLSRCGSTTKVVLLGDPEQIDHPYLDFRTNGLSVAADKLKGSSLVKQITMLEEESKRSLLSLEIIKKME